MRRVLVYASPSPAYDANSSQYREKEMGSIVFNTFLAGLLLWLFMAGI
ncbi:MAG: hypothetical protein V5B33_16430 [Candidatus Accumulibacter sp. UW20]|jgi:hypothetical protein